MVLYLSFPVIIIDELLKFIARNFLKSECSSFACQLTLTSGLEQQQEEDRVGLYQSVTSRVKILLKLQTFMSAPEILSEYLGR